MDDKAGVVEEAKRLQVDTEYSSRSHFEARRLWNTLYYTLGGGAAVLTAIGTVLAVFFWAGLILTGTGAGLMALATFLRPSERAQAHSSAGARLNALHGKLRYFGNHKVKRLDVGAAETELESLRTEKEQLNSESPGIPRLAYLRAKRGIQQGESSYKEDFDRLAKDGD